MTHQLLTGTPCPCKKEATGRDTASAPGEEKSKTRSMITASALGIALWFVVYLNLAPLAEAATTFLSALTGFDGESHLGSALAFFIYEVPKVLMLLTLVVFAVGIVRSFFTPEKTRAMLAGKGAFTGNILAALLGIVTPFCSCSAVPLFLGFVTTGVPLGATFSFLISAPMINEIALVLLYGLFGWKVAALYLGTGLAIAMTAGWVIGKLNMEGHLESWVHDIQAGSGPVVEADMTWADRIRSGVEAVGEILGKVWLYVILGIAVGAGIHGYVPEGVMAGFMGKSAWWSVPLSVLLGIPMYSNAAGIIPIVQALLGKGAALGTVLAFMMSVIALSLPEIIILRKVLKPRLIATFIGVVGTGILLVGYLFNLVIP
ncbi:permease [Desulfoluna spongiiphila]|uniref:permease n=1 Tax=Desulfoluna spongiiphila TaxID=419481 RepID=UPI0012574C7E|nr:permease [Desulfoluna spongiiphila]VVS92293.1 predicted permease duf318 [Desulfoluna spongiiphila]